MNLRFADFWCKFLL
uniref:Uncharacterized protein n=1 Tax=Rhizophora mucronata TaxID=61149 RepID=A0A2P2NEQ8_RHIMU